MIDFQSLSAAVSAINTAKELAKGAMGMHNAHQITSAVTQINAQLLDAQNSLFNAHMTLSNLREQHLVCMEELRSLKATIAQREEHALVRLSDGVFVYAAKALLGLDGAAHPIDHKQVACICQGCLDQGRKFVLIRQESLGAVMLNCPGCGTDYLTGEYVDIAM